MREKDYPPSIRDIQEGCDISSTSVVDYNLKALERLGYIRRDREVSRAIELCEAAAHAHAQRAGRGTDRRRSADSGASADTWSPRTSRTTSKSRTR